MVGRGRTFVFDTLSLDEIKAISKGFGVTINDLFVAAAAGAYRRFMQTRGYDPDTGPLVAAIPVSKRPPPELDDMIGNKTSTDYLAMPVHLADPEARLKAAAHAGNVMKEHLAGGGGRRPFQHRGSDTTHFYPPARLDSETQGRQVRDLGQRRHIQRSGAAESRFTWAR